MKPSELKINFILQLRKKGITNFKVLSAMEKTPREHFLEGIFQDRAYEDIPLPILCGQTISQPSVVGRMTQALEVSPRGKVLEIGTGSGYQTAILSTLARRVYTIERHQLLALKAKKTLDLLEKKNITIVFGDGAQGMVEQAPFDRIILTAATEDIPKILLDQLKLGGVMVLPVGQSETIQRIIKLEKTETGINYYDLLSVRFLPLIEGKDNNES
jgi:protein-L-isoaspartate(D-aspartate) O-methyltransferase